MSRSTLALKESMEQEIKNVIEKWQEAAEDLLDFNRVKEPYRSNVRLLVEQQVRTSQGRKWENYFHEKARGDEINLIKAVADLIYDHGYLIGFPFAEDPTYFDLLQGVQVGEATEMVDLKIPKTYGEVTYERAKQAV